MTTKFRTASLSIAAFAVLAASATSAGADVRAVARASATAPFQCSGPSTDMPDPVTSPTLAANSAAITGTTCGTSESTGGGGTASASVLAGVFSASGSSLTFGSGGGQAGIFGAHAQIRNTTNQPLTYAWIMIINGSAFDGDHGGAGSGNFFSSEFGYLAGHPDELTTSWSFHDGVVILIPHLIPAFGLASLDYDWQLSASGFNGGSAQFAHTGTLYLQLPDGLTWDRAASGTFLSERTDVILGPGDPLPIPEPSTLALLASGGLALVIRRRRLAKK